MNKVSREDILGGSIIRTIFRLGWPVMVTTILQVLYNLADTFWLGHLPKEESGAAVAGLQISWPIVFLLISFVAGFAAAGVALISQYTGAGMRDKADLSCGQVYSLSFVFGVLIGGLGYILSPRLLPLITQSRGVTEVAIIYIQVIFLGMPFIFASFLFASVLQAYGDTVTPMLVSGVTVLLNVILDPLFIFGRGPMPKLGVLGAALATVICQTIASGIALYILFKGKKGVKLRLSHLRPQLKWVSKIFKIGLPASIGHSGTAFGFVVLMAIIGRVPNAPIALAAYGIGDRVIHLMFICIEGLGVGLTTILGQSLGAEKIDRAEAAAKRGSALMFLILVAEAAILWLLRKPILSFFIPGRPDIIDEGAKFISIFVFGMPFFGIFQAAGAVFRGSGHNLPTMIMELSRLWVLRVPLSYLFAFVLTRGSTGVWMGMAISNIIGATMAIALFTTGIWKEKVIEEKGVPKV